jgi:hypothetical protein
MRREMVGPDLGGDKHLIPPDARGAQPLADLAFVLIDLRGIDMAVTEFQRLLDHAGAGSPAQFPGAQADRRDSRAIGFD